MMDNHLPEVVQNEHPLHSFFPPTPMSKPTTFPPNAPLTNPTLPIGGINANKGSQRTIWILSVSLVLVILAAVGAGVGGGITAVNHAKDNCEAKSASKATVTVTHSLSASISSPPTSTSTSTSISTATATVRDYSPPTAGTVALDCGSLSGNSNSLSVSQNGQTATYTFGVRCDYDYPLNDIVTIVSYSLQDCMYACASYNLLSESNNCAGLGFITTLHSEFQGNCFLKTKTENGIEKDRSIFTYAAAVLHT